MRASSRWLSYARRPAGCVKFGSTYRCPLNDSAIGKSDATKSASAASSVKPMITYTEKRCTRVRMNCLRTMPR